MIRKFDIGQAAGPVSVNSSYTNIKITGASDFILQTIKYAHFFPFNAELINFCIEISIFFSLDRLETGKDRIKLKIRIPSLSMKSNYSVNGRIIMIPVTGNGKLTGNFTEIEALVMVQGEQYKNPKTQKKHFRVLEFYVDIDIGNSSIHLDNLFNGDKTLADAMNVFLNENWKIVAAEIKPAFENSISNLFKQFASKIFDKYPLDILLPL